ncbi:MAG: preprotein translocase subunit SecA [Verrucomicrobiota bacterium]|nr:preprotein translocase subunit SecA [Verrucomicrobiota bacterium]
MFNIFKALSGSHYRRFYKRVAPIVVKINEIERSYQNLSDEQLRAKTGEFMERYRKAMEPALAKKGERAHEGIREANQAALDALLPEAFAAVKNAARRLCGRECIVVGQPLLWNMVHFDVQLIGGIALHENKIAEMATGEGKTLVSTLPLYLNALTGHNCQLVTVNEYLAQRDAEWMGVLHNFLGITVGVIKNQQNPTEKRAAYECNITYGTASEFGFDYLRDNGMASRKEEQVQREHYFCIIDEADSILVDEARTPLIISGPSYQEKEAPFAEYKPAIERIFRQQLNLCNRLASDAKAELDKPDGDTNLALSKLLQCKMGAPKHKQFHKFMEDNATRKLFEKYETEMSGDFNKEEKHKLKEQLYYGIDEKQHTADLTELGREFLRPNDNSAFVLPDLVTTYMELDKDKSLDPQERDRLKLEAQQKFDQASEEIHVISQLLRAYSLYERDVEYVVQEGKVLIVDENTGRVMAGRRWSDGLHQAVEAKENVAIEKETKTYATITIQNYFRLYEKLAGMTGTAETEANEFMDIYKLGVMVIPTNRPCIRKDQNDIIYKTRREKFNAAIEEIKVAHERGQPVLVGTVSVEASELLSRMLRRTNIVHTVLNAKFHQQEAEIIARAGQRGAVTIATNMAGRGTDIKLAAGVPDEGGLYVIGTERHTSRRIDRQLRGRCARQGDPGMTRFFLSLEDDLMRLYSHGLAGKMLENSFEEGQPLEHAWLNTAVERAQKTVEQHHYSIRKRLLQYDDVLNQQREVIYSIRNDAIHKELPKETIFELIEEEIEHQISEVGIADDKPSEESSATTLVNWANIHFPLGMAADDIKDKTGKQIKAHLFERVKQAYALKEAVEDADALRGLERYVIITTIDKHWQDHLTEMDELRNSVGLRGYGQKDPLNEYKSEAYLYFEQMMNSIRNGVCTGVFRSATSMHAFQSMLGLLSKARAIGPSEDGTPVQQPAINPAAVRRAEQAARPQMAVSSSGSGSGPMATTAGSGAISSGITISPVRVSVTPTDGQPSANETGAPPAPQQPKTITLPKFTPAPAPKLDVPRPGRNDDCPCGSGKKYKKCCYPKWG